MMIQIENSLAYLSSLFLFIFFFFLSLRCLCIIRDGSTSDDDSNSLYLTFIRIVTSTTNNFLRLFFSENDTYPFLTDTHSHRRLISLYSKKQSGERKGKQCAHMPIRIVRIKRRRSDRVQSHLQAYCSYYRHIYISNQVRKGKTSE